MDNVWIEKLAIRELCSRYCQTIDAQDSEGWARCFLPDGAFEFDGHVVRGCGEAHTRVLRGRHMTLNHLYNVEGDRAADARPPSSQSQPPRVTRSWGRAPTTTISSSSAASRKSAIAAWLTTFWCRSRQSRSTLPTPPRKAGSAAHRRSQRPRSARPRALVKSKHDGCRSGVGSSSWQFCYPDVLSRYLRSHGAPGTLTMIGSLYWPGAPPIEPL
jgi:SnoaL-like domain